MILTETESFDFRATFAADGTFEEWKLNIENEMQSLEYQIMKECILAYSK
jgi:hypothetical protein